MFEQALDPMGGSRALPALVAAILLGPRFVMLGVLHTKAHVASLTSLGLSIGLLVNFTGLVYLQSTSVLGWRVP